MVPSVHEAADLISRWDFQAARAVLEELVAAAPPDDPDTLEARRMLAEVLRELGDADAALPRAAEVTEECRLWYGPDHPLTVRATAVLATVLHDRGELAEARRYYLLAVHSGATLDGPAGRAVLLVRANLALLYRDCGDLDTAERDLTATYRTHRQVFGAEDRDTLRLGTELGKLYRDRGDVPAARRMLAVCHATARAGLGEEHPLTAIVEDALTTVERPVPGIGAPQPYPAQPPVQPVQPYPLPEPVHAEDAEPGPPLPIGRIAVVTACLGILLALVGTALALAGHRSAPGAGTSAGAPGSGPASGAVAGSRSPPRDIALRDAGTSITVTWTDPSGGAGTVLLALRRGGSPAGPLRPLPAGTQREVLNGLDPTAEYCLIIALVYPGDTIARADEVCTHRHS